MFQRQDRSKKKNLLSKKADAPYATTRLQLKEAYEGSHEHLRRNQSHRIRKIRLLFRDKKLPPGAPRDA